MVFPFGFACTHSTNKAELLLTITLLEEIEEGRGKEREREGERERDNIFTLAEAIILMDSLASSNCSYIVTHTHNLNLTSSFTDRAENNYLNYNGSNLNDEDDGDDIYLFIYQLMLH